MNKRNPTAGLRMIGSARQALAFAEGKEDHGCEVHVPDNIDVKAIREKISLSQGDFAKLFGLSKRTLEHWAPSAPRPRSGLPDGNSTGTGRGSACVARLAPALLPAA